MTGKTVFLHFQTQYHPLDQLFCKGLDESSRMMSEGSPKKRRGGSVFLAPWVTTTKENFSQETLHSFTFFCDFVFLPFCPKCL